MRVLVTGSSGYIGQRVIRLLAEDPKVETILGLDIVPPKGAPAKLHHVHQDVTIPFDQLCSGVDAAIHLAFVLNPMSDEALQERINLGGTANFIRAVRKHKVPTVIGLTSSVAYGAHPDNPELLTEEHPLRGNVEFAYARDKVRQEALFNSLRDEGICVKIVRPVVVLGPTIQNYISRYLTKPVVIAGRNHSPMGQFVHEDDVARALALLLHEGPAGPYNLAGDGFLDIDTMAKKLGRTVIRLPVTMLQAILILGWGLGLKMITEAPPGMLHYIIYPWLVDNQRLKSETGFEYRYTTEETFDSFAAAHRR